MPKTNLKSLVILSFIFSWHFANAAPFVYVTEPGEVLFFDAATNLYTGGTISIQNYDNLAIAITPDSRYAYVCGYVYPDENVVSVIDLRTNTVLTGPGFPIVTQTGRSINSIAITPDGQKIFVTTESNSFYVITNFNQPTLYTATGITESFVVAISPDGEYAYITDYSSNTVLKISVADPTIQTQIPGVGASPFFNEGIAITADSNTAYVCNANDKVYPITNLKTSPTVGTAINTPSYLPTVIAITPNSHYAYVGSDGNSSILIIDINTNMIHGSPISLSGLPKALAFTPEGTTLYASGAKGVYAIPTSSNMPSFINLHAAPAGARGIAIGNPPQLLPPTNLTGCILQRGLTVTNTISWDAPTSGVLPSSYNIYRDSYTGSPIATVPGYGYGPFVYEDPDLDPNMTYTYYIQSEDIQGDPSQPASITLSGFCYPELFPPSGLSGSCSVQGNNTITWEAPLSGATPAAYAIYSDASLTHLVATVPGNNSGPFTYELAGLNPNLSYTYYIVSLDDYGDESESASITVQGCTPPSPTTTLSPTNLTATRTRNEFLLQTDFINIISWSAPSSGTTPVAYNIYRDAALSQLIGVVPATDPLQFYDHDRQPNTTYTYYITSVDVNGNNSAPASVTITG